MTRRARAAAERPDAGAMLASGLGDDPALVLVFASPRAQFGRVMEDMARAYPEATVLGCTTAGEIAGGYVEDEIVAIAFARAHFATEVIRVDDLAVLDPAALVARMIRARHALAERVPAMTSEFAFLMVDGTSLAEDSLMAAIANGLGPVPLFGGSAGDGVRFDQSLLAQGGRVLRNAALLCFIRTDCRIRVFSFDHLDPRPERMVVTSASPARRIVHEINAEPAAREYARILGKNPDQLDPFTFAAHPLVVRVGGRHFVRAIQKVNANGDLVLFSAIDEGVVLTLASPRDMARSLDQSLTEIAALGPIDTVLACDCILRRIEAEQRQSSVAVSDILRRHNVVGFSTYGEQFGAMHVNLTMTGVAIFRPEGAG